jgi:membrane-bound ClpP family serine protease
VRRLPTVVAIAAVLAMVLGVVGLVATASTATADTTSTSTTVINEGGPDGFVAVVKVSGLLDPVMVDFIRSSISDAESEGAVALILQTDSDGVVVDDATFAALLNRMLGSSVPIGVWVGPSGSHLTGPSAQLVGAADQVGMAPGSRLGNGQRAGGGRPRHHHPRRADDRRHARELPGCVLEGGHRRQR